MDSSHVNEAGYDKLSSAVSEDGQSQMPGRQLYTPLCRFTVGDECLEIVQCSTPFDGGGGNEPIARFSHAGAQFLVRRLDSIVAAVEPLRKILTAREFEIVGLVAGGLRNKQIAYRLSLSEYTVAAYIKQICYKLQVRNRTAMVTRCNQLVAKPLEDLENDARRGPDCLPACWRGEA